MSYTSIIVKDAPIAYWKMNEISGTIAIDTMEAHDGIYVGTVYSQNQPGNGIIGPSLYFPNNFYIQVPTFSLSAPFTLEIWLRPENYGGLFYKYDISHNFEITGNTGFWLTFSSNLRQLIFRTGPFSLVNQIQVTTPEIYFGNLWYYVVVTVDESGNSSIYINPTESLDPLGHFIPITPVVTGTVGLDINNSQPLLIGREIQYQRSKNFVGNLMHCAIYNYVLTIEQIKKHYYTGADLFLRKELDQIKRSNFTSGIIG